jgi:hypothetical protein
MSELNDFNQQVMKEIPGKPRESWRSARQYAAAALDDNRRQKWSGNHKAAGVHERWRSHRHRRVFRGRPKNPPWYHNLVANPEATVELGSERLRVRATATSGEERQRLFNRHAEQMPIFTEYQQKTTRQIPVFVLTRLD